MSARLEKIIADDAVNVQIKAAGVEGCVECVVAGWMIRNGFEIPEALPHDSVSVDELLSSIQKQAVERAGAAPRLPSFLED